MEEIFQKISWEDLENLSYQTRLGKSLKNTLRRFDKDQLYQELRDMIVYYTELAKQIPYENRVKSILSCEIKYNKYYPNTEVEKVFNDILGLRIIVDNYDLIDSLEFPVGSKIADMRNGKASDDGYRGFHVYLQKDHFRYPIEVQFFTPRDKLFNAWLHDLTYKYIDDARIGRCLRKLYDQGEIETKEDFRKELEHVLSNSQEV